MQIVNESMIYKEIDRLLSYGIITGLVEKEDLIYTRNRLLELLELEDYHETGETIQDIGELEEILYQNAIKVYFKESAVKAMKESTDPAMK